MVRRTLAAIGRHPRHLVLGAVVAGLLAAPAGEFVVLPAAVALALLAARPRLAVIVVVALFAGALFSEARLQSLDAGVLGTGVGHRIESRAIVLEPVRERVTGPAVAR